MTKATSRTVIVVELSPDNCELSDVDAIAKEIWKRIVESPTLYPAVKEIRIEARTPEDQVILQF